MENFRFYVLCEVDEKGAHVVGHFSKEYGTNNNLACIMVLPPFQRKGYGKLLIQLSYAISRREHRIGTPEKPLSDLGKVSYRSYWWWVLLQILEDTHCDRSITVTELSELSSIHPDDIQSTFKSVQMIKFSKGECKYCFNRLACVCCVFRLGLGVTDRSWTRKLSVLKSTTIPRNNCPGPSLSFRFLT